MTATTNQPSRRDLLKWFAESLFTAWGNDYCKERLSGCNDSDNDTAVTPPVTKPANLKTATFTAMAAPIAIADRAKTSVSSKLKIDWDDSTSSEYQLGYKSFFETGNTVPKWGGGEIIAGGYFNANGDPIMDTSVPASPRQFFSDCPDGSSLIHLDGAQVEGVNNPVFHVVQFEYASQNLAGASEYGNLPSPIAILTLDQNQTTGHLELKNTLMSIPPLFMVYGLPVVQACHRGTHIYLVKNMNLMHLNKALVDQVQKESAKTSLVMRQQLNHITMVIYLK